MNLFNYFSRKETAAPEPQQVPLKQLRFIIHPGDGTSARDADTDRMLLQRMSERTISLDIQREIAVVLLQMSRGKLQEVRNPSYGGEERALGEMIEQMETALPGNLIIMPSVLSIGSGHLDMIFDEVRERTKALGFDIHQGTNLLAYGEMITQCVPIGAKRFANHFRLNKPPTIDANCTDAVIKSPKMWERNGVKLGHFQAHNGKSLRYIPLGEKEVQ